MGGRGQQYCMFFDNYVEAWFMHDLSKGTNFISSFVLLTLGSREVSDK